jgi:hypothetical protein
MAELLLKFELLDPLGKQQLLEYLNLLLSTKTTKKGEKAKFDVNAYRKNLLKVSVWSDEDIALIEEARQHFNNWKVKEW